VQSLLSFNTLYIKETTTLEYSIEVASFKEHILTEQWRKKTEDIKFRGKLWFQNVITLPNSIASSYTQKTQ
jgi:hypothetical protein